MTTQIFKSTEYKTSLEPKSGGARPMGQHHTLNRLFSWRYKTDLVRHRNLNVMSVMSLRFVPSEFSHRFSIDKTRCQQTDNGRVTTTTLSSKNRTVTLSHMNFSGYVGHVTWMLTIASSLRLGLGSD